MRTTDAASPIDLANRDVEPLGTNIVGPIQLGQWGPQDVNSLHVPFDQYPLVCGAQRIRSG